MTKIKTVAGPSAFLLAALFAAPAESQLYAREAPPNSAFVRAFNNSADSGVEVSIGERSQPPLLPYSASAYIFMPANDYPIHVGAQVKTTRLEANHFYTAVGSTGGIAMFELSGVLNRLKSMIAIFNLMPATTLALKTADGSAAVFESVAPGAAAQREINPLKLSLALFEGAEKLSNVAPVTLGRGKVFSLFIGGSKTAPVMVWNDD